MPERSSISNSDNNKAASMISQIIDAASQYPNKNPAAVALGRLGGLKGGLARAAKLSSKRRQKIARLAAKTRWKKAKSLLRRAKNKS